MAIPNGGRDAATRQSVLLGSSTGWLKGGELSANADTTKFDYAAGKGIIVDSSDPDNPTRTEVTWDAGTAITPAFLNTAAATFLLIDIDGNLVQQATFPESPETRNNIQIGAVVHAGGVVTGFSDGISTPVQNVAVSLNGLMVAIGALNASGNEYSGDPAGNLSLQKSAGKMFYIGANGKLNPADPNRYITPVTTADPMLLSWKDGAGSFGIDFDTVVQAGVYDDGTGGVSGPTGVLNMNFWTNHRLYYSPDGNVTVLEYGQVAYNSDTAAIAGMSSEMPELNPTFSEVPFRAVLTMRGGASDLSDPGDAIFTQLNKYGIL